MTHAQRRQRIRMRNWFHIAHNLAGVAILVCLGLVTVAGELGWLQ